MEEGPSSPTTLVVSNPSRTLSLLRNRQASAFTSSSDSAFLVHDKQVSTDERSGGGLTGEHGPKTSEVYGFVGSFTTVIATVIYLVWAYTPEPWLHSLGITYYPSKYWALAVPSFLMATPPPYSLNVVYDEYSREPSTFTPSEGMEKPIDPISDVGINQINLLMFGDTNQ